MLKRLDSGRATFLPVDTVRGNIMKDAPVNDPGFVGIAYDLVSFDKRYDGIFANLPLLHCYCRNACRRRAHVKGKRQPPSHRQP